MAIFVVMRVHGLAWDGAVGMRGQELWDEHAAFMDELVDDGVVVLGGPLGGDRAMVVVDAESPAEALRVLAEDPWVPMELLVDDGPLEWTVLLGALPSRPHGA